MAVAEDVRFAPERDYGPFVFVDDDGRLAGLSVDVLALVARQAGLQLQMLPAASLKEQLQRVRDGQADLLSSLRPTPERGAYLAFSRPYVSVPAIVVGRAGDIHPSGLPLAALGGRPVAVGDGYGVESFVRQRHPQVRWVEVSDDVVALVGVAQGRFDAAVVDAASAAFVRRRHRLRGLQRLGEVGFEYTLSFAVPRARTELLARIDAAIRDLPRDQLQAVVARWLRPVEDEAPLRVTPPGLVPGLVAMGVALMVVLARRVVLRRRRPEPP